MLYAAPGAAGAKISFKPRYDNFINGQFVAPVEGRYFDVITPISGKVYTQAARSGEADIERALDAAHAAAARWARQHDRRAADAEFAHGVGAEIGQPQACHRKAGCHRRTVSHGPCKRQIKP